MGYPRRQSHNTQAYVVVRHSANGMADDIQGLDERGAVRRSLRTTPCRLLLTTYERVFR